MNTVRHSSMAVWRKFSFSWNNSQWISTAVKIGHHYTGKRFSLAWNCVHLLDVLLCFTGGNCPDLFALVQHNLYIHRQYFCFFLPSSALPRTIHQDIVPRHFSSLSVLIQSKHILYSHITRLPLQCVSILVMNLKNSLWMHHYPHISTQSY